MYTKQVSSSKSNNYLIDHFEMMLGLPEES